MKPCAVTVAIATLVLSSGFAAAAGDDFSPVVSNKGEIMFPSEFRREMTHLGSWFVPEGEASGFHDVYMDRQSVESYLNSGRMRDGAVLVKELRAAEKGDYTTGRNVAHATPKVKQWFVMVKDNKGRFVGNPLWGDGWGWALFKPEDPGTNVARDYTSDCRGCHIPARSTDWIYKEAYPLLQGINTR